jgi:hypothetical protein
MFVSDPVGGAVYLAHHRTRGGRVLIWTRVPVAPGPEVRGEATEVPRVVRRRAIKMFHGDLVRREPRGATRAYPPRSIFRTAVAV